MKIAYYYHRAPYIPRSSSSQTPNNTDPLILCLILRTPHISNYFYHKRRHLFSYHVPDPLEEGDPFITNRS